MKYGGQPFVWENTGKWQSPGGTKSENLVFSLFFNEFLAKIGPRTSGVPSWSSWQSMDVFRQHPTHFWTFLHFWFFFEKKTIHCLKYFWSVLKAFPIFSCFFELWKLRDQSQIVDLVFAVRTVSSRASETSKISKWWQNNVPKRSKKHRKNNKKSKHQK